MNQEIIEPAAGRAAVNQRIPAPVIIPFKGPGNADGSRTVTMQPVTMQPVTMQPATPRIAAPRIATPRAASPRAAQNPAPEVRTDNPNQVRRTGDSAGSPARTDNPNQVRRTGSGADSPVLVTKDFSGIGTGDFSSLSSLEDFGDSRLYSAYFALDERKRAAAFIGIHHAASVLGGREAVSLFDRRLKEEKNAREKSRKNHSGASSACASSTGTSSAGTSTAGASSAGVSSAVSHRPYTGTIEEMTNYKNLPKNISNLPCGPGWIATDRGVSLDCGKAGIVTACRHPVLIAGILESLTTGEEKLVLLYRPADRWRHLITDADTIASASQITKLKKYGVSVTSENARLLVRFLQDMEDYGKQKKMLPVFRTTSKLGWTPDKKRFLPYGSSEIRFDGQPEFQKIAAHLKPHGKRQLWLDAYRKLRGIPMLDFLTAGSLAAPIVGMLENDGFVCNLYGESGTGKSVTNKIACSLWSGCTSREGFLFGADNKLNGMESILDVLNNLPLLLEDLNNMPESGQKSMQSLIMKIANGIGKARATKTMGIQQMKTWHTTAIMTSENRVTKDFHNTGAVNRVLLCRAEPYPYPGGPEKAGELLSVFENNYGFAGQEFVSVLEKMGKEGVQKAVQQAIEALTRYLNESTGGSSGKETVRKSSRQILPAAMMLAADRIAERYIFRDGKKIPLKTAASWMADEDEANQYSRFYQTVTDAVILNIRNFERTSSPMDGSDRTGYEYWGKYDETNGYVYFLRSVLEKLAEKENVDIRMFLDYLQKHGLFEPDRKSRTSVFHSRELNKSLRGLKIKMPQEMVPQEMVSQEMVPQDTEDEPDGQETPDALYTSDAPDKPGVPSKPGVLSKTDAPSKTDVLGKPDALSKTEESDFPEEFLTDNDARILEDDLPLPWEEDVEDASRKGKNSTPGFSSPASGTGTDRPLQTAAPSESVLNLPFV